MAGETCPVSASKRSGVDRTSAEKAGGSLEEGAYRKRKRETY